MGPDGVCFWKTQNSSTIQKHRLDQILAPWERSGGGRGGVRLGTSRSPRTKSTGQRWRTHLQQEISFRNLLLHQPRGFTVVFLGDWARSVSTVQGDWGWKGGGGRDRKAEFERASVGHLDVSSSGKHAAAALPFQRDPVCVRTLRRRGRCGRALHPPSALVPAASPFPTGVLVPPSCSRPVWESPSSQCDIPVLFPSIRAAPVLEPYNRGGGGGGGGQPCSQGSPLTGSSQVHLKDQTAAARGHKRGQMHERGAVWRKNSSPFSFPSAPPSLSKNIHICGEISG